MSAPEANLTVDLSGLNCPLPILRAKKALADLPSGTVLQLICTDPGTPADFEAFCRQTGHALSHHEVGSDGKFLFWLTRR
ncbi:sulfurtransferase TusA family protein [Chitinimonas sp. BJYL2]|uniref:sulfurtransferase TusA family protein n=1 Tax=Chitinimonas sp. BJYL2 TaxID=2976696 RepID=UPI0022B2C9C2|nr:sulfurtransferase TusA family protein [Chitinimonas sp. BJYL2]